MIRYGMPLYLSIWYDVIPAPRFNTVVAIMHFYIPLCIFILKILVFSMDFGNIFSAPPGPSGARPRGRALKKNKSKIHQKYIKDAMNIQKKTM